jgi:hypothetical protein
MATSLAKRDLMKITFISASYTLRYGCSFVPSSVVLLSRYRPDIWQYDPSEKVKDNQFSSGILSAYRRWTNQKHTPESVIKSGYKLSN